MARGGVEARARLRAWVWEEYLASGRRDHCGCVDHFFDHLDRRLAGAHEAEAEESLPGG